MLTSFIFSPRPFFSLPFLIAKSGSKTVHSLPFSQHTKTTATLRDFSPKEPKQDIDTTVVEIFLSRLLWFLGALVSLIGSSVFLFGCVCLSAKWAGVYFVWAASVWKGEWCVWGEAAAFVCKDEERSGGRGRKASEGMIKGDDDGKKKKTFNQVSVRRDGGLRRVSASYFYFERKESKI